MCLQGSGAQPSEVEADAVPLLNAVDSCFYSTGRPRVHHAFAALRGRLNLSTASAIMVTYDNIRRLPPRSLLFIKLFSVFAQGNPAGAVYIGEGSREKTAKEIKPWRMQK